MLPIIEQQLSKDFGEHMQGLLSKEEYLAFQNSFEEESARALRLNPRKVSQEAFLSYYPEELRPVPWILGAYYYPGQERPSRNPLYGAGAYYLQDAGAMTPLSRFPIVPGDRVLDLCAAPGGKSTAAGAALCGEGILVANDVSPQRAKALLRNLELFGISNCIVMSEEIETLCDRFPQYFDKIILDAPCSGEGMFRKDPSLAQDWTLEKSMALSRLQEKLILQAYEMLAPGGCLLYSTCTYERGEDEQVLEALLHAHPDMHILPVEGYEGFAPGVLPGQAEAGEAKERGDTEEEAKEKGTSKEEAEKEGKEEKAEKEEKEQIEEKEEKAEKEKKKTELRNCVRIYPHRMRAEGHFFACLQKEGPEGPRPIEMPSLKPGRKKEEKAGKRGWGKEKPGKPSSRKREEAAPGRRPKTGDGREPVKLIQEFFQEAGIVTLGGEEIDWGRLDIRGDKAYLLPSLVRAEGKGQIPCLETIPLAGLHFLRLGLYLGDLKKDRFEPSQPLALSLLPGDVKNPISLGQGEEALLAYLRGETLEVDTLREAASLKKREGEGKALEGEGKTLEGEGEALEGKGYRVLCVEEIPLAFTKLVGGTLKNKLPSSWRLP